MPTGSSYPSSIVAPMKPALFVSAGTALVLLAGCATTPVPEEKVATLQTTQTSTPPAPSTATKADSPRPRERLDMTPADLDELGKPYMQCLVDHGYDPHDKLKMPPADMAKAETDCLGKKPLPPWEYDTANPESLDFIHKLVLCLRGKGVKYVDEVPPEPGADRNMFSFGGANNDSDSITKGLNLTPVCEKELSVGGNR